MGSPQAEVRVRGIGAGAGAAAVALLAAFGAWGAATAAAPAKGAGAAAAGAATSSRPGGVTEVRLDAREAARHVLHVRETIPVQPGPATLAYPKWIPGEHGPTGPVIDMANLVITAGGKKLDWRRGPDDMYLLHVDVPAGASALEVSFDQFTPATKEGFGAAASASAQLAIIAWNQFILYPRGANADEIKIAASITLPEGWQYGTALRVASGSGSSITFKPASLTTVIDSPLLTGAHFKTLRLSGESDPRPAYLHVAADSDAALQAKMEIYDRYRRLVNEEIALFGARHYDEYHFLLALSDHVAHFGLEHHESSDNRIPERGLVDDDVRPLHADLLAHEMTHSWNAKYRRPKGLVVPDYQSPIDSHMLWVYEGLTNYIGDIVSARSGLRSAEDLKDYLAWMAAEHSIRPGRAWRPLEDTGTEAQLLYDAPKQWESYRRSVDFYEEGTFLWLEVDMLIRQKSGGQKSLDDFCKLFHGAPDSSPKVVPYTEDDVYAALGKVVPNDWRGFFKERVQDVRSGSPLGGLEASGWRLGWTDEKPKRLKAKEGEDDITDARFSIGLLLDKQAVVTDALGGSPAEKAGIAPGMKVIAVNGRRFDRQVFEDALRAAVPGRAPSIDLLVENAEFYRTYTVPYDGGLRYPALERRADVPDTLADITRPHAATK